MHWAAARGKLLTVALLAAREADVDAIAEPPEINASKTASDLAAENGHLGMAAFLAELQLQQGILKLSKETVPQGDPSSNVED